MNWNNTTNSANQLVNTVNDPEGWKTGWGVEVNKTGIGQSLGFDTSGIVENGSNTISSIISTGNSLAGTFTDGSQYVELADAAGSAALNYLNQKIQRIKDAWTTTTPITVKTLLGEIAPYCMDWPTAVNKLSERISSVVGYMLGVNADSWQTLGDNLLIDVSQSLLTDPAVTSAVSNLDIVQGFASGLSVITNTYSTIKSIFNMLEPLFPYLEIATNLAAMFMTGGTSGMEASSKTTQVVQAECQKLISLLLGSARKALYNIKFNVPSILVGALETLSVRDAMMGYGTDSNVNAWLSAIFDESFYQQTLNSFTWSKTINETLNQTLGWAENTQTIYEQILGDSSEWGSDMKDRFLSNLTANFMKNALTEARRKAYIQDPSEIIWIDSNDFSSLQDSILSDFTTADGNLSSLDKLLNKNLDESPITDESSIRLISYNIYTNVY